jgi:hypothetical protein
MVNLDTKYIAADRITRGGGFNEASEAFLAQLELLESFFSEASAIAEHTLIVIFPSHEDLVRASRGEALVYRPLMENLESRNLEFLDLSQAFGATHAGQRYGGL